MFYWINVLLFVAVVTVNALANILPINGKTTGDIANRVEVLFTPAGYVFSIWSLIYILLATWLVFQFERRADVLYTSVSRWFALSCLLNIAWILCWHYGYFALSVVIMVSLLSTLIVIYLRSKKHQQKKMDLLPFSIYLGWISVATVANISYLLVDSGWDGWGIDAEIWTVVMMFVATILARIFLHREHDVNYVFVFIWALVGIGVANLAEHVQVAQVAFVLSALLIYHVIRTMIQRRKQASTQAGS
jgi:benzodiazapine receptor